MTATTWNTLASLATALGTLVLAIATFAAIRSANKSARVAEHALLVGMRPMLVPTREEDATLTVNFGDGKWVQLPGGGAAAETEDDVVYFALPLRNVGPGMGVLHGWLLHPGWFRGDEPPGVADFRRQARDLYVPSGDLGFWQGAFRDPADPQYEQAQTIAKAGEPWTVDLLYGDHEGGQRVITRFTAFPHERGWLVSSARHWNTDRPNPRTR